MDNFSVLIAGKAGFGIDKAGSFVAHLLNQLGLRIYIYRDYPSIIRGGHTFSIIRASTKRIFTHQNSIDFLLALNQDTLNFHRHRLKDNSVVIYDSDSVKLEGLADTIQAVAIPLGKIIKEENAPEITRNTGIIGAFCKVAGINSRTLELALRKEISREVELNLKVALKAYDQVSELVKIEASAQKKLPILTGNQAIALGLIKAGLKAYVAYPMTPSSPILHFLAAIEKDFDLKVIHPESEIGVILMALGFSYSGEKVAVGTSGGGFCLMIEGLSFAGMAELPIVIVMGQRTGPSTGLPTYTGQSELHFVLNAGQGEFPRFIVAPGDAEEAYFWSAVALNVSWQYQMPSIILSDKSLGEGVFNFDIDAVDKITVQGPILWDRKPPYKRYLDTPTGVSPLAFVPEKDAIIKINSYEHDEFGITIEDARTTKLMQEKRLRKERYLSKDITAYKAVKSYGNTSSSAALLCWGSNKGVCIEVAEKLNLKVIQPIVLSPFPVEQFNKELQGVKNLIVVENNATGQLEKLIRVHGFSVNNRILRYDGRPFSLDELEEGVKSNI
jgi:2-oxoglutarate ferredoxin oxidoreductase subunit alpha